MDTGVKNGQLALLKVSEVAKWLSLSRTSVYALMSSGELAWVRVGSARRVKREAVEQLIERGQVHAS